MDSFFMSSHGVIHLVVLFKMSVYGSSVMHIQLIGASMNV